MQWASGGGTRLGNLPTVRMSLLLAHIILNVVERVLFVVMGVSEWASEIFAPLSFDKKHKTWHVSRVRIRQKAIQIESANIFPFLSNANVGLSFPKWTRWMSRMCGSVTFPHPHTHTHTVTWGGGGGDGGVMAQSLWFFHSVHPSSTQDEWIIYNHFLSGSSDWCDSWPPNSLNLIICHSWEKLNHSRTFTHPPLVLPVLPMLQRGQYGKQILDNTQQRNGFPFNAPPTCQSATFSHCERFHSDLYHINWFTVYVHKPGMMYHDGLSHKSFLFVSKL